MHVFDASINNSQPVILLDISFLSIHEQNEYSDDDSSFIKQQQQHCEAGSSVAASDASFRSNITASTTMTHDKATGDSMAASNSSTTKKKRPYVRKRRTGALTCKGFKRQFANHNYHDRAAMTPEDVQREEELCHHPKGGVPTTFPPLLHKVLEDADTRGHADIISWQPHGRAFRIHNAERFAQEILPHYFQHQKISSFQRQLSLYGFIRLTRAGVDHGAYYHEYFLRQRPFLCVKLQRKRVKGTWVRKSASPESEPDFYSMSVVEDWEAMKAARTMQSTASEDAVAQQMSDVDAECKSILNDLLIEPTKIEGIQAFTEQPQQGSPQAPLPESYFVNKPTDKPPDMIANHDGSDLAKESSNVLKTEIVSPELPIDMDVDLDLDDGFFDFNADDNSLASEVDLVAV